MTDKQAIVKTAFEMDYSKKAREELRYAYEGKYKLFVLHIAKLAVVEDSIPLFSLTPIEALLDYNKFDELEIFFKNGIHPDEMIPGIKRTALMWSARKSKSDAIRFLIKYGADINKTIDGYTALDNSIYDIGKGNINEKIEIINFLLSEGAKSADKDLLQTVIIRYYDKKRENGKETDEFENKEIRPQLKLILDKLLTHNVGVGQSNPLWTAIYNKDLDMIEFLLEKGVDPNKEVKSSDGDSRWLMLTMAMQDIPEAVEVLLKHGADPNIDTESYDCPLYNAVKYNKYEVAKKLLEAGAKTNILIGNSTPLVVAVSDIKSYEMTELLLKHGADPNMELGGDYFKYVLDYAYKRTSKSEEDKNMNNIRKLLLKHGAKGKKDKKFWESILEIKL